MLMFSVFDASVYTDRTNTKLHLKNWKDVWEQVSIMYVWTVFCRLLCLKKCSHSVLDHASNRPTIIFLITTVNYCVSRVLQKSTAFRIWNPVDSVTVKSKAVVS